MVGVSAVIALVLDRTWFPPHPPAPRRSNQWAELAVVALAFIHLVKAPLDVWLTHRNLRAIANSFDREIAWLEERVEGKTMVVLIRSNMPQSLFVTPTRLDPTIQVRNLSYASGRMLLLRTGPQTIELVAGPQPLFPVGSEDLVRNEDAPLHTGDTVTVPGMRATVVAVREDGTARRVRYEFDHDLDDPQYLWVVEHDMTFREQKLPAPGQGEPLRM
jgi:hypothetical protein